MFNKKNEVLVVEGNQGNQVDIDVVDVMLDVIVDVVDVIVDVDEVSDQVSDCALDIALGCLGSIWD